MSKNLAGRTVSAFVVAAFMSAAAFAQTAGSLRGTVTDPTGGIVPGATVVLTNVATKFAQEAVTDARGAYFFAAVEPGTYTLTVEMSGFKRHEATGLRISPNATAGADVVLEIGEQTETVTVTATRELIQTRSGAREGLITAEQIESQSILGRNPLELLRLLPGVVAPDPLAFERVGMFAGTSSGDAQFAVNGARAQNMGFTLDGANLRDVGANTGTLNVPNNEFVAEVSVQASNYAAEFGSAAIQVHAVTKSGSSRFHGSAFDYIRHHSFAANDRSRSLINQEKPKSNFNYPGFSASGPILIPGLDFNRDRNKAFFFFGFELARQRLDEGAFFGVTPTPGQRVGHFNDYQGGQNLNQPGTVLIPGGFPGAGSPAPNNDLSPYITPLGRALMNLYPAPNFNDPDNRYNYVFSRLTEANRNQFVLRTDYNLTSNTRAYVRIARDYDNNESPRGLWWASSGVELPTPVHATSLGRSAVANLTSVLSPTSTNEVIVTWSQLKNDNRWQDPSLMRLETYGITESLNPFGPNPYLPQIVNQFDAARGSMWSANDVDNIFSYNGFVKVGNNYTKVLNTHAIKLGANVERQYKTQNFNNESNVQLNFAPWGNGSTGSDFGDLLVGRPAQAVVGTPSAIGDFVAWNVEAFAQDSWRLRHNVTLEYGLRFGKWTNNAETNDLGAIFRPDLYQPGAGLFLDPARQRVNGLATVAAGDVPQGLTDARPLLFMPRANAVWDLRGNGQTIFRAGGGLFYNREQGNAQYGVINVPPNAYDTTLDSYALGDLAGQGLTYSTMRLADPFSAVNAFDLTTVSPTGLAWPRMTNVSASVAQRIPWRQTVEIGYVGAFGDRLAAQLNQNVIPIGGLSSGTIGNANLANPLHRAALQASAINTRRPFPALQNIFFFEPIGESTYHSMQLTVNRQTGAFNYLAAYTLSKATGTVGNDFAQIDPIDPARTRGVLAFDRRHIFNFSWTAQLGTPVERRAALRALLNDWNLSGVSTFLSGTPIRLGFAGDLGTEAMARAWFGTHDFADFGAAAPGAITPTFTCDPRRSHDKNVGERVLDINCIGIPGFGESGPFTAPYDLRAPSRSFHDLTVFKNFRIDDARRVQFRAGFFNIFNQAYPIYNAPGNADMDLVLDTACNVRVNGVPDGAGGTSDNICDPTGGFQFTQNTLNNFGRIFTKRGHRVVEFAFRFFW